MAEEATLASWAAVAAAVAATRATGAKVTLVAEYLRGLNVDDVVGAARALGGRVFPAGDARVLGMGGAGLSRVLRELTGISEAELSEVWGRHADAGATVLEVVAEASASPRGGDITLAELWTTFKAIAAARGAAESEAILLSLLKRCDAAEAGAVAKLLTGDLRIGLREGLVETAIAEAFAAERSLVERATMLTGDLGEVARLAATTALETAMPQLFVPLRFMLAAPAPDAESVVARMGEDVWVEDKYDGIRCQVHSSGGRVALYSRDLKEITRQFPDIAVGDWPDEAILDGEILAFKDGRVLPFFALQRRLGRRQPAADVLAEFPALYVAWDLLYSRDTVWLEKPLRERRAALEALSLPAQVKLSHRETVHGASALDAQFLLARARLNEGLMVKRPDSLYLPGRRGYHWMKLKRPLDTLDVVVVGAEYGHGKRRGVLSDVTFAVRADDGQLVTVGKAYTGLTDVEIAEMTDLLHQSSIAQFGRYHTVEPRVVLEVAFDSVQASARHKSGYALRFPRIVTWRRDKGIDDIDTLERVRGIAEARAAEFTQRVDEPTPD